MKLLPGYRSPQAPIIIPPKNTYGLILKPKEHICNAPGWFKRFMFRVLGAKIRRGSLFRCPECKVIKEFRSISSINGCWEEMNKHSASQAWVKLGGEIEEEDK